MIKNITIYPNEKICFIDFKENNNSAHFRGYKLISGTITIDCFMYGNIDNNNFESFEDNGLLFKGRGKGRKSQKSIDDMKDFIQKCILELENNN